MQEQQVKPAEQARQGRAGLGVRYVLGIGIALVVVAFAAIYIAHV
ncbi:MAG TPA: hypothetical protein PLB34_17420 [Rhodoblastus sp.]|nr:hypothetical protein [Rhodoblastus sp.]